MKTPPRRGGVSVSLSPVASKSPPSPSPHPACSLPLVYLRSHNAGMKEGEMEGKGGAWRGRGEMSFSLKHLRTQSPPQLARESMFRSRQASEQMPTPSHPFLFLPPSSGNRCYLAPGGYRHSLFLHVYSSALPPSFQQTQHRASPELTYRRVFFFFSSQDEKGARKGLRKRERNKKKKKKKVMVFVCTPCLNLSFVCPPL